MLLDIIIGLVLLAVFPPLGFIYLIAVLLNHY